MINQNTIESAAYYARREFEAAFEGISDDVPEDKLKRAESFEEAVRIIRGVYIEALEGVAAGLKARG